MKTFMKSIPMHIYEVRPRKDHRGVDLISDVLPFGRLCIDTPDNAIGYAMHSSRLDDAPIRILIPKTHPMNILPQSMKRLFH